MPRRRMGRVARAALAVAGLQHVGRGRAAAWIGGGGFVGRHPPRASAVGVAVAEGRPFLTASFRTVMGATSVDDDDVGDRDVPAETTRPIRRSARGGPTGQKRDVASLPLASPQSVRQRRRQRHNPKRRGRPPPKVDTSAADARSSGSGSDRDLVRFNMELNRLARRGQVESAEEAERMLFDRIRDFASAAYGGGGNSNDGSIDGDNDGASRAAEGRGGDDNGGSSNNGGGIDGDNDRASRAAEGRSGNAAAAALAAADVISFNSVLHAWARCGCADRAAALLSRMEYLSSQSSFAASVDNDDCRISSPLLSFRPNHVSYATVIDAWARSGAGAGARQGAREAENILRRVEDSYRQGIQRGRKHRKAVHPNVRMYSSVINALAKSRWRGSGRRADAILKRMGRMRDLARNSTSSSNIVDDLSPNSVLLTAVIDCHAQSRSPASALRAENILRSMTAAYDSSGNVGIKPTPFSYAAVINALATANMGIEGAERAAKLLHEMETSDDALLGRPNVVVYTNVCRAWARSGHPECGEKAESIYRRMLKRAATIETSQLERSSRPNVVLVTAVIEAHSKSSDLAAAPHRAQKLLDEMDELHLSSEGDGDDDHDHSLYRDMRPDSVVLSAVLGAWARSPEGGAADRAAGALREMWDRWVRTGDHDVKPNAGCVRTVIRAHLNSTLGSASADTTGTGTEERGKVGGGGIAKAIGVLRWAHDLSLSKEVDGARTAPRCGIRPDKGSALDVLEALGQHWRPRGTEAAAASIDLLSSNGRGDDPALERAADDLLDICAGQGWFDDDAVATATREAGLARVA